MTSNSINFAKICSQVIKQTQLYNKHDLGIQKSTHQKQFRKVKCCLVTKGYDYKILENFDVFLTDGKNGPCLVTEKNINPALCGSNETA